MIEVNGTGQVDVVWPVGWDGPARVAWRSAGRDWQTSEAAVAARIVGYVMLVSSRR